MGHGDGCGEGRRVQESWESVKEPSMTWDRIVPVGSQRKRLT